MQGTKFGCEMKTARVSRTSEESKEGEEKKGSFLKTPSTLTQRSDQNNFRAEN